MVRVPTDQFSKFDAKPVCGDTNPGVEKAIAKRKNKMDKSKLKKIGGYIVLVIYLFLMAVGGGSSDEKKAPAVRRKKK